MNKALVIDYSDSRLISCGSLFQGVCTVRSLRNISNVEQQIKEPVVANNATASTVAFIVPGPPNPPISQVQLLLYADTVYLSPAMVNSDNGFLLETYKCQLMQLVFTGRCLYYEYNEDTMVKNRVFLCITQTTMSDNLIFVI